MQQEQLIIRSKAGDKKAREEMVLNNVGLIWSIVRRFSNRGYDLEELFQVGCIGLIKAIDKFDLSYQVKFSTYAVPLISGEIKRFLRDDGMIKVSRSLKEIAYKISLEKEKFQNQYQREATIEELSNITKVPIDEIVVALEANKEVDSLSRSIHEGDGKSIFIMDTVEEKSGWEQKIMDKILLNTLMKELKEEEKQIIDLRYYENKTQKEVGQIMGISQVQVSRLEKKILLSLRKKL